MELLKKSIRVNSLFDLYSNLLTEKQQKIFIYYYQDDLSLSEISDLENVSRNAIYDSLKKSISLLELYEEKLGLLKKQEELEQYFSKLKEDNNSSNLELIQEIEGKVFE
ncbi:MAG: hypothetical protein PUA56_03875 [Bacillales bacterium]|nr:hypothetical protein [Bacillales bacterium]